MVTRQLYVVDSPITSLSIIASVYAFIQTSKEITRLQLLRQKKPKSSWVLLLPIQC